MSKQINFSERLAILKQSNVMEKLAEIKHGVERETLRINPNGTIAHTGHAQALGSALTHDTITTDFSESLLEFITPPEANVETTLNQLQDIHKYVVENIGQERLWPMSMPCFLKSDDDIPLAQYGTSNIGKMKTLYRQGLKNRYGSMMQAIAGVHFNFSFSDGFWEAWIEKSCNTRANKETISEEYFAVIRNYRRFCWLIPYLFGASPALCSSFIKGKKTTLPFKQLGKGTLYLEYATSLRMSDLGYTNSEQSDLRICYNNVDSYIHSLHQAINTPSQKFQMFAGKKDGQYQQLNANVLQIENELYSPIRPKQPANPLEKPSDALASRGVSYIEVRALDVNPFNAVGIEQSQFYFLDVFLTYCLVLPSECMSDNDFHETEQNLRAVVVDGRNPELRLSHGGQALSVKDWATKLFADMEQVALVLDEANGNQLFSEALALQWQKILHPENTPSAQLLETLLTQGRDNGALGVELAEKYKQQLLSQPYAIFDHQEFEQQAAESIRAQTAKELADDKSFDDFLSDYFSDLQGAASFVQAKKCLT